MSRGFFFLAPSLTFFFSSSFCFPLFLTPPRKQRFSSDVILDRLKVTVSEADEQSEALAEQLTAGDLAAVDEFVRDYQNLRRIYHERGAKAEKLQQLIENR